MAVKRHKLDVAIKQDFCLLGIVTDESDYKLCWLINQALGTEFLRLEDLELYHKKLDQVQLFPIFGFTDQESFLNYRIICNRIDQGFYLDEVKNLDYLVHIQGEINQEKIAAFLHAVAALPEVRLCLPVDLKKIRNQERLLLW